MKIRRKLYQKLNALQFDGTLQGAFAIANNLDLYQDHWNYLDSTHQFLCKNFGEIPKAAEKNDWIIKFEDGKIYPCKPEVFELNYEEVV